LSDATSAPRSPDAFRAVVEMTPDPRSLDTRLAEEAVLALGAGVKPTVLEWLEFSPETRLAFIQAQSRVTQAERQLLAHEIATALARNVLAATR
jgi:hypothetical protein